MPLLPARLTLAPDPFHVPLTTYTTRITGTTHTKSVAFLAALLEGAVPFDASTRELVDEMIMPNTKSVVSLERPTVPAFVVQRSTNLVEHPNSMGV